MTDQRDVNIQAAIDVLEGTKKRLKAELQDTEAAIKKLKLGRSGVELGDIVIYLGTEYRVADADMVLDKPFLYGNPRKKDGTFGTKRVYLSTMWKKKE